MKFNENPASRVEAPERFKERLDTILNRPLTVENINEFGDDALNELIPLVEKVVATYKATQSELPSVQKDIEDSAFKEYQLGDIEYVLEQVQEKIVELNEIDLYIAERVTMVEEITTPPDARNNSIQAGNGSYEAPSHIPRLKTLLYILANDFGIDFDEIETKQGNTSGEMVRQTGYVTVEIPELNRAVLLCDEAENATYVFDTAQTASLRVTIEDLDRMTKSEKNQFIAQYSTIGRRVVQNSLWREQISRLLKNSITFENEAMGSARDTEFSKERPKFLPYGQFETEVREAYSGGDIVRWYTPESKKHPGWPATPRKVYKNKGWKSWSELVGKERIERAEFLPYGQFETEVREAYPGGDVAMWYRLEEKDHANWPSNPPATYARLGWKSWPELVGKEKVERAEFLPFEKFQEEVQRVYDDSHTDIAKWYTKERLNHSNWPSNPNYTYRGFGWKNWREVIGKERFLSFDELKKEVRSLFPIDYVGSIPKWYRKEKENHINWPAVPDKAYKESGWISWMEFVGKEK